VAADVGVAAWGRDLPGASGECALRVFNLIVPTGAVQPSRAARWRRGPSVEALLVNWLNECLYVHELEGFAVSDLQTGGHGDRECTRSSAASHRPAAPPGTVVKAAFHAVEVTETAGPGDRPGRSDI
jgi:SHS2 domain-containing protein